MIENITNGHPKLFMSNIPLDANEIFCCILDKDKWFSTTLTDFLVWNGLSSIMDQFTLSISE